MFSLAPVFFLLSTKRVRFGYGSSASVQTTQERGKEREKPRLRKERKREGLKFRGSSAWQLNLPQSMTADESKKPILLHALRTSLFSQSALLALYDINLFLFFLKPQKKKKMDRAYVLHVIFFGEGVDNFAPDRVLTNQDRE